MVNLILSVLAAVIPAALYVVILWRLDRYEKEPLPLFAAAFIWGAVPAVIAALFFELLASLPFYSLGENAVSLIGASLTAPIVEEASKAGALLLLFWLFRSEFDGVLDGIIYGAVIGFGFAMTENVFYYVSAWSEGGAVSWGSVVLLRGVAFGLNHAMYTAITGAALGYARYRQAVGERWLLFILGLLGATIVHILHNVLVSASSLCLAGLLIDWAGVAVIFVVIALAWRQERKVLGTYLADELALGTLNQLQYDTIVSQRRRLRRGWALLGIQGRGQARIWSQLVNTATELAFKKYQLARMGNERRNGQIVADLRNRLVALQQQLAIL